MTRYDAHEPHADNGRPVTHARVRGHSTLHTSRRGQTLETLNFFIKTRVLPFCYCYVALAAGLIRSGLSTPADHVELLLASTATAIPGTWGHCLGPVP